jgi:alkylation response protein AidB-like acyl-CoA dehydrogenase
MRFAFTEDQQALGTAVSALLDDHCPPSAVRAAWDGDRGPAERLWVRLADLGLLGALVPEADGGLGLDELDVLLGLEASGRAAVPVPLVETAVVAARLLAGTGHADWLPGLAGGELRVSASLDGSSLLSWSGFCDWALVGDVAGVYLLPVRECVPVAVPTLDQARPMAELTVMPSDAWLAAHARLVSGDSRRIAAARRAGALATAAQLIGLADRMLARTVDYVQQRHQFGVPIGSFQAVKHALADALLALELARPLVYAAAWAHVHDADHAERDVSASKIRSAEAAGKVARTALQAHGGMGYTQENDLHLWLKRTWALQASWGRPGELRERLAQALDLAPSGIRRNR